MYVRRTYLLKIKVIGCSKTETLNQCLKKSLYIITQARLFGHFTRYCHFNGNMEGASLEKILDRKLPLRWKQPTSQNCMHVVMLSNNNNSSDLLT